MCGLFEFLEILNYLITKMEKNTQFPPILNAIHLGSFYNILQADSIIITFSLILSGIEPYS